MAYTCICCVLLEWTWPYAAVNTNQQHIAAGVALCFMQGGEVNVGGHIGLVLGPCHDQLLHCSRHDTLQAWKILQQDSSGIICVQMFACLIVW